MNKLLKVDTYLSQNYQYLMEKLVKEYDTPILIKSKHDLEDKMNFRTVGFLSILGLMAVVITVLVLRQIKNKKLFDKLMQNEPPISTVPKKGEEHPEEEDSQTLHEISPEIELAVVKSLEKFEQSKKYLEKEMVLSKMAALIKTNPKYLSKIILKHRGKKFIEYISDLKIDHIVALLKEESKYRNYKNKALGEEAGFGSTQNFTKAFKNRTGLSPTYFIHKLKSQ